MGVSRETGRAAYKIRITPTFGMWATVQVIRTLDGSVDVIGTRRVKRPIAERGELAGREIVAADQAKRKAQRVSLVKAPQRVSLIKPGRRPAVSLLKTQERT